MSHIPVAIIVSIKLNCHANLLHAVKSTKKTTNLTTGSTKTSSVGIITVTDQAAFVFFLP